MKRSWFSIIVVAGLIGALCVLGLLQYRWLVQASESEADKMQKRLASDTERFTADFNREIQNAYFNFQIESGAWKRADWTEFNQRYDFWLSKTSYPEIVKKFIYLQNVPRAEPLVYSPEKRSFEKGEVPPEFLQLRERFTDDRSFSPIYAEVPALVVPVHDPEDHIKRMVFRTPKGLSEPRLFMPRKAGFLVIILDSAVIRDRILPDLASKYFPDGDYSLAVSNNQQAKVFQTGAEVSDPDQTAKLFDLASDKFIVFENREMMRERHMEEASAGHQVQTRTMRKSTQNGQTNSIVTVDIRGPEEPRRIALERTASSDAADGWTVQVQHRDGSIGNYISKQRQRSLGMGFGLLSLLALGISVVYFSAMRARRFAQRQVDFVSSVSHEFRTPLAVIHSAGENLEDGVAKDPAQVTRYGSLIKNEGKKLSAMVEQILQFAGADSGRQKYKFDDTDVREVITSALRGCSSLFDANNFTVETNIPEDLPNIHGDRNALSGAVGNLIANSVKYSNGSKWIRVSAVNGNGGVKIIIEDRGIGIPAKDIRQVFEPFFRSKEVVDAQIHGNGLGLSLVKQIAEAHGGKVTAKSERGKGSSFTIELPQRR